MFYGREEDIDRLGALWMKPTASLVTCRGRRRIGKSTLIEEFARRSDAHFLVINGLAPREKMTNKVQLDNFAQELSRQTAVPNIAVPGWADVFALVDLALGTQKGRTVLLLDEISWMGKYDPDFAGHLKNAWDARWKKHTELIVVLCGSVSSWISDNILHSTGFVGRISLDLVVDELPLRDCLRFWRQTAERTAWREVVDVLSVTGGVAKYLEEMKPELSADENIRQLCFSPGGFLVEDFNNIFNDIFGKTSSSKKAVLEALGEGARNIAEISAAIGTDSNGHLSRMLEELELAGFIIADEVVNPATGGVSKEKRYRIRDNYTRFYLHFIAPRLSLIKKGRGGFKSLNQLRGWESILGLQFENLILNNVDALLPLVGLGDALVTSAAPYRNNRNSRGGGCQVDLLIQTRKSICVVEIKRQAEIGEEVAEQVREKVKRIPVRSGVSVRTALVYDGHLAPALREDGYFDFLIPVEKLF